VCGSIGYCHVFEVISDGLRVAGCVESRDLLLLPAGRVVYDQALRLKGKIENGSAAIAESVNRFTSVFFRKEFGEGHNS
jgi:hypothetical protein